MSGGFPSIGIDFGTTNSSMAWYNPDTQQAEIILNAEGEYKTPSLVYFGEEEILVGKSVEDMLEDSDAFDEAERQDITQRVVRSIKRNLVSPPVIPIPGRAPLRPIEVVAQILGKLKRDAEQQYFHEAVDGAVITCPAVFDSSQRKAVSDAATQAGFRVVELVEEPVAAAMAYARMGRRVGAGVLVYDLGGGTFDLAVVAREEDESFRVAMEPDGDPLCGGDDLDRTLYDHCDRLARRELGRPIDFAEGVVNPYFLSQCRKKKERLSVHKRVHIRDYLDGVLFKTQIDRSTFEELIWDEVDKTVRKTAAMVERAEGRGREVDTVVMIGGASRVPLLERRLRETLPVEPRQFANKDYAVALGAAYHASVLEVPVGERYRKALEVSWADEQLSEEEVAHLDGLAQDLELNSEQVAEIEREVLGETVEAHLERRWRAAREEYFEAVKAADEKLDEAEMQRLGALATELGLGTDAEEIEREVLGDTKEATRERRNRNEFRRAVIEAREQLNALAAELGLGEKQVSIIVREVLDGIEHSARPQEEQKPTRRLSQKPHIEISQAQGTDTVGGILDKVADRPQQPPVKTKIAVSTADDVQRPGELIGHRKEEEKSTRLLKKHKKVVMSVAFSPDSKMLASGSADQTVQLWHTEDWKPLRTLEGQNDQVMVVTFSPDGKLLASGSGGGKWWGGNKTVRLWRAEDGAVLRVLEHENVVQSVAFSPDGKHLASGSLDRKVRLWHTEDGTLLHQLNYGNFMTNNFVNHVAFSPDGKLLAAGGNGQGQGGRVRLWLVEDGAVLRTLKHEGEGGAVMSVAFSPNGELLASSTSDRKVRLWRVDDGAVLRILEHEAGRVQSVAFSPDGELLASSGLNDGKVRLWRVENGELVRILEHAAGVTSVAFSPNGELLASGCGDGNVWLWQVI